MSVEHKVFLIGSVGEEITLVNVVSSVNSAPPGTDTLRILIDSGGGIMEVGDNIYDYLNSMRGKYRLITEQVGFIGSIATKLFLVGDERIADRAFQFGIHNPWTIAEGDASKMDEASKGLRKAEKDLTDFYSKITGLPESALTPLMNDTTVFDAETAVNLKFATTIKNELKIAANMKPTTKSAFNKFIDRVMNYFDNLEEKPLNMVVELEDGTILSVEGDGSKLEGMKAFTVDEAGTPTQVSAPDGVHKLKDGRSITIDQGVITQVSEQEDALIERLDKLSDLLTSNKIEAKIMAEVENRINSLRNEIKTTHTPPRSTPDSSKDDAEKWDKLFRENRMTQFKKENPEEYARLHFAKWGKVPN